MKKIVSLILALCMLMLALPVLAEAPAASEAPAAAATEGSKEGQPENSPEAQEDLAIAAAIEAYVLNEYKDTLTAGEIQDVHPEGMRTISSDEGTATYFGYISLTNYSVDGTALKMDNSAANIELLSLTKNADGTWTVIEAEQAKDGEEYAASIAAMAEKYGIPAENASFYFSDDLIGWSNAYHLYEFLEEHPEYTTVEYQGEQKTADEMLVIASSFGGQDAVSTDEGNGLKSLLSGLFGGQDSVSTDEEGSGLGSLLGGLLGGQDSVSTDGEGSGLGSLLGGLMSGEDSEGSGLGSLLGGLMSGEDSEGAGLGSLLGGLMSGEDSEGAGLGSLLGGLLGGEDSEGSGLGSLLGGLMSGEDSEGSGLSSLLGGLLGGEGSEGSGLGSLLGGLLSNLGDASSKVGGKLKALFGGLLGNLLGSKGSESGEGLGAMLSGLLGGLSRSSSSGEEDDFTAMLESYLNDPEYLAREAQETAIKAYILDEYKDSLEAGDIQNPLLVNGVSEMSLENGTAKYLYFLSLTNYTADGTNLKMKNYAGTVELLNLTKNADDTWTVTEAKQAKEGEEYAASIADLAKEYGIEADEAMKYFTQEEIDWYDIFGMYMLLQEHPEFKTIEYQGEPKTSDDLLDILVKMSNESETEK